MFSALFKYCRILFVSNGKFTDLKKDLQEDEDYLSFNKLAFDQLSGWYGIDHKAYGTLKLIEDELELDLTEKMYKGSSSLRSNIFSKCSSGGMNNLKM